eukprot:365810-Chlamydomonas_euryale.AAC.34
MWSGDLLPSLRAGDSHTALTQTIAAHPTKEVAQALHDLDALVFKVLLDQLAHVVGTGVALPGTRARWGMRYGAGTCPRSAVGATECARACHGNGSCSNGVASSAVGATECARACHGNGSCSNGVASSAVGATECARACHGNGSCSNGVAMV